MQLETNAFSPQARLLLFKVVAVFCLVFAITAKAEEAGLTEDDCETRLSRRMKMDVSFSESEKADLRNVLRVIRASIGTLVKPSFKITKSERPYLQGEYFWGPQERDGILFGEEGIEISMGRPGKSRNASLVFFAHEYGHAIFEHNLLFSYNGKLLPLSRIEADVRAELENQYEIRGLHRLKAEVFKLKLAQREDEAAVVEKKYFRLYDQYIAPLFKKIDKISALRLRLRPYTELFADLVALIWGQSPSSVADAMALSAKAPYFSESTFVNKDTVYWKDRPNAPRPRDFSQKIKPESWRPDPGNVEYTYFDPLRSYLGEHAIAPLLARNKNAIEDVLRTFLKVTSEHVNFSFDEEKLKELSPTRAPGHNKDLIKLFLLNFESQ